MSEEDYNQFYDDEEQEFADYGDEEFDDYEDYDQGQEYDIGFSHLEHIGRPMDEWGDIETRVFGDRNLENIQQRIFMTDETKFRMELDEYFKRDWVRELINEDDERVIQKSVETLSFVGKRNPLSYILGYYLVIDPEYKYTRTDENTDMFEIIKYSSLWS